MKINLLEKKDLSKNYKMGWDKKGVSVIVAYVLLVVMALSMSVMIYQWLKFQATPVDEIKCPDEVSLIIEDVECSVNGMNVYIKNRGFFTFDGYIMRVSDFEDAEIGIYVLHEFNEEVVPAGEKTITFPTDELVQFKVDNKMGDFTFLEVQPFIYDEKNGKVYCEMYASKKLSC
mgnify:FL=1|jgi:hypothetical protein